MRWKQTPRSSAAAQGGRAQSVLSSRWFRGGKLIWACNLALAALLACIAWGIVAHRAAAVKHAPVQKPASVAKAKPSVEPAPPETSGGGSLLGDAGTKTPDSDVTAATQLPLKLLGTIATDREMARAIIEDTQAKSQKIYRIGETVAGAHIEEIGRTSVVLLVNNRREILEMSLGSGPDTGPKSDATPTGPPPVIGPISDAVKSAGPRTFKVSKEGLLARIGGYESVMKAIQEKIKPYDDGKVKGLQINGLDDISMATLLDLQNGDVIQAVNGQNMNSLQKAWQVWQKAKNQPDLDVQLMRGDSTRTLHFSLSGN